MTCKWQVEIDPYCQKVLAKHWPNVRRHDDVRTFPPTAADEWGVDVICGGFPCQDISTANPLGAGIDGERSGLWREYSRIIRAIRPSYVIVENVANLLKRGISTVLGDLASLGYDAEWESLPAFAFGAPHYRRRVYIVAYAKCRGLEGWIFRRRESTAIKPPSNRGTSLGTYLGETWGGEPSLSLLDDGLSGALAEFSSRATGNAVVPQIAQWLGERIIESCKQQ